MTTSNMRKVQIYPFLKQPRPGVIGVMAITSSLAQLGLGESALVYHLPGGLPLKITGEWEGPTH